MRLLAVDAKNFRSYQLLQWAVADRGLYLVDGINPDTGRSNMAGKTTLFDSIVFGLFGYLPKWGGPKGGPIDAVIRRGEESCRVEVLVEHAGRRVRIVRERPAKLSVFVDGVKQEGKISDLDSRIPELVGMSASQFLLSIYISQDRSTSFFSMSDSDRTRVLSVISGLEDLNRALEKAKQIKSDLQSQSERLSGSIEATESQINRLSPQRDALILHQSECTRVHQELLHSLSSVSAANEELLRACEEGYNEERQAIIESLQEELGRLSARREEVDAKRSSLAKNLAFVPDVEPELKARLEAASNALSAARVSESQRHKCEMRNQLVLEQIEKKLHELKRLEDPKHTSCPTCLQALPQSQVETTANRVLEELRLLEGRIEAVPPKHDLAALEVEANEASMRVLDRKAELQAGPSRVQNEVRALEAELSSIDSAARSIQSESTSALRVLESDYQENVRRIRSELRDLEHRIQMSQKDIELGERQLKGLQEEQQLLTQSLIQARTEMGNVGREMDEVLDLIDLFGPKGFRAVCFEGLIARISDRAGELFSAMTDGAYSTRLDQTSENAKGEERVVLRPTITKGGLEVPVDDLSGGARRMAMLAYDISVAESVGDSSALFLDEALDGLDAVGKAEALRALEKVAVNRAVYIVDHTSEIRSAVQDVLVVEYRHGASTLLSNSEVSVLSN